MCSRGQLKSDPINVWSRKVTEDGFRVLLQGYGMRFSPFDEWAGFGNVLVLQSNFHTPVFKY